MPGVCRNWGREARQGEIGLVAGDEYFAILDFTENARPTTTETSPAPPSRARFPSRGACWDIPRRRQAKAAKDVSCRTSLNRRRWDLSPSLAKRFQGRTKKL